MHSPGSAARDDRRHRHPRVAAPIRRQRPGRRHAARRRRSATSSSIAFRSRSPSPPISQKQVAFLDQPRRRGAARLPQPARCRDHVGEPRPADAVADHAQPHRGRARHAAAGRAASSSSRTCGGRRILLGEGSLDDRAVGEDVEIGVGEAPGVTRAIEPARPSMTITCSPSPTISPRRSSTKPSSTCPTAGRFTPQRPPRAPQRPAALGGDGARQRHRHAALPADRPMMRAAARACSCGSRWRARRPTRRPSPPRPIPTMSPSPSIATPIAAPSSSRTCAG